MGRWGEEGKGEGEGEEAPEDDGWMGKLRESFSEADRRILCCSQKRAGEEFALIGG